MFLFLVQIIFVCSFLFLGISYLLFCRNIRIARFKAEDPVENYGISFESVNLFTSDNIQIAGWLCIAHQDAPTIVICHGLGSSKHTMLVHANYLHQAGFNVFLFDFRAHGESGGRETSFGYCEQRDLDAVIKYIMDSPAISNSSIGILGESMGAATSIMRCSEYPNIHAICADSCYPELSQGFVNFMHRLKLPIFPCAIFAQFFYSLHFHVKVSEVSPLKAAQKILNCAVFYIAGTRDARIPLCETERLFAATKAPKHIWILDNARHVEAHALDSGQYRDKVTSFFKKYLAID